MDASVPNSDRILPHAAVVVIDSKWMRARRLYWAARRHLVQREVLSFVHLGQEYLVSQPPNAPFINVSGANTTDDAIADAIARQSGLKRCTINARLAAGQRIVHANAVDGRLLAWGWIALPTHPTRLDWEADLHIEINPGVGYLFGFETMASERNRGLYRQLLDHAVQHCYADGAKLVSIYCRADNLASQRGICSAGFTATLPASVLRLGPWFRVRVRDHSRWGWSRSTVRLAKMLHS